MKYQSSTTKLIHDLTFDKPGRYRCPECAENSKRKDPKDLQYYGPSAFCHKCEATLYEYKPYEKKEYKLPERKNDTKLTDKALKYWEGRMISQKTLNKMGVYSDREMMPKNKGLVEVICFPFFRDGELINIKFRGPQKSFKQVSDAELIWYNFDALSNKEIIICEGEGEVLTWIENGYDNVVSVPSGAGKNTDYLDATIKMFDDIEIVYLATDVDEKGVLLRDELARRIGPEKCYYISFKECKDGNEFFCKHGGLAFKELYDAAKPVPVAGIVKIDQLSVEIKDLYNNGIQPGMVIDQQEIDKFITWELGRLAIATGVPGSGKSEAIDYIVSRLNLFHGWKAAFFTPENYPLKYHYSKLHEKYSGIKFRNNGDDAQFSSIFEHIRNNYYYILDEEDFTVDSVLNNAKMLVKQYGVKILVLDPYNRFEHDIKSNQFPYSTSNTWSQLGLNDFSYNNSIDIDEAGEEGIKSKKITYSLFFITS